MCRTLKSTSLRPVFSLDLTNIFNCSRHDLILSVSRCGLGKGRRDNNFDGNVSFHALAASTLISMRTSAGVIKLRRMFFTNFSIKVLRQKFGRVGVLG